jgi:hypothetical protein
VSVSVLAITDSKHFLVGKRRKKRHFSSVLHSLILLQTPAAQMRSFCSWVAGLLFLPQITLKNFRDTETHDPAGRSHHDVRS